MDWHHPSQYVDAPGKDPTAGNRPERRCCPSQKPEYVDYMKAQLKELVTKYDPAVLWFDGEWIDWWTEEDGQDLYAYVRGSSRRSSSTTASARAQGHGGADETDREYAGDFGTPEQQIPATGFPGVDWESCMTMNDTWGFKSYDENWKSAETLVRNLIDIASKGGNYLLNVGPTAEGEIPAASVERLGGDGQVDDGERRGDLRHNGEPVLRRADLGSGDKKGSRLYLHVFDWPVDGKLAVPSWGGTPAKAWLDAPESRRAGEDVGGRRDAHANRRRRRIRLRR